MKKIIWFFLFCSATAMAQTSVTGFIKDYDSQNPIPFATVSDGNSAVLTDVTGKFELKNIHTPKKITVSYIGYQSEEKTIATDESIIILLKQLPIDVYQTLTDSSEFKATALLNHVFREKTKNNPFSANTQLEYKIYNKLLVTADVDSIIKIPEDSVFSEKKKKYVIDSSVYKFKKLIKKQHLFQTEKVSSYQYNGKHSKETVLGTKMSGFKQPVYEIIGFELQSNSIYDDFYDLFETKYISPISKRGLNTYRFKILDTLLVKNKPAVLVYFKNKKHINRKGLEGVLYIDYEKFAVSKAVFRIRGILDISSVHYFDYDADSGLWIPEENEFKIVKGENDDPIKLLGGTIRFDGEYEEFGTIRKKEVSDYVYIFSRSVFFDWQNKREISLSRKHIALEIPEKAIDRPENFWEKYRKGKLNQRDINTYKALDSIFFKGKWENKLIFGKKIINGYVPVGPIDWDLRYLLSFNNYEGFRLGMGGITNEKLSKKFRIDGYGAYGTKDGTFKYGIGTAFRIGKFSYSWLGFNYTDDIQEIAATKFTVDKNSFKIYDPRPLNLTTFYHHKTWQTYVETRILPKTEAVWKLSQSSINPLVNYAFVNHGSLYQKFEMTTAQVSVIWHPFSDFMQTPTGKFEKEKRYPKFTFQFTQSLPDILDNDFTFGKIDFRTEYEKKLITEQKISAQVQAGYAFGDVPLTHLYSTSPNSLSRDRLLQRITVAGKNSFETMRYNEFFSSRYVMLHLKYGFKRVQLFNKVKPSLVLVTRMGWGDMENPEKHIGINYKNMNLGYYESGIELNQIFKGFGISGFYRYGPYQFSNLEDNISLKLTFQLDLGF